DIPSSRLRTLSLSLSVLSRSTVVNSLLLSQFWRLALVVASPPSFSPNCNRLSLQLQANGDLKCYRHPSHKGGLTGRAPPSCSLNKCLVWKGCYSGPQFMAYQVLPPSRIHVGPLDVAAKILSLKASIAQASLPESVIYKPSPIEWWLPPTDNTIQPLPSRIGDLFELTVNDNNRSQATNKPQMSSKQKIAGQYALREQEDHHGLSKRRTASTLPPTRLNLNADSHLIDSIRGGFCNPMAQALARQDPPQIQDDVVEIQAGYPSLRHSVRSQLGFRPQLWHDGMQMAEIGQETTMTFKASPSTWPGSPLCIDEASRFDHSKETV
ncbi:MAG: hypothetical protein JOS17DRAFT_835216, partial [Linnemannia elongata]